jgi:hypothetical protein
MIQFQNIRLTKKDRMPVLPLLEFLDTDGLIEAAKPGIKKYNYFAWWSDYLEF